MLRTAIYVKLSLKRLSLLLIALSMQTTIRITQIQVSAVLYPLTQLFADDFLVASTNKTKKVRNWRPRAIRLKNLFALGIFLALIVAAISILYSFSSGSRLHQKAFTYEADLSRFGLRTSTFVPFSIAPNVVSIIIFLWWDQLDMTFRLLQPYISMSRSPTPFSCGAGLTYRSKSWVGAAIKATRHRHWVLFFVAVGSRQYVRSSSDRFHVSTLRMEAGKCHQLRHPQQNP
jgi:hypothetical protein